MVGKETLCCIGLIVVIPFFSQAYAASNDIIWTPVSTSTVPVVNVAPFQKGSHSTTFTVSAPSGGAFVMKAISTDCNGYPPSSNIMNNQSTHWLMIRTSPVTGTRMNYTISFNDTNVENLYSATELGGPDRYSLVAYSRNNGKYSESLKASCIKIGDTFGMVLSGGKSITGTITFMPYFNLAGHYSQPLDIAWAYEENRYLGSSAGMAWRSIGAVLSSVPQIHPVVEFDLQSSCSYSARTIQLSHGTISLKSGVTSYQSDKYPVPISCDFGSYVRVSLKGADPVPGKTENYTQCGSGTCRLTFDTDSQDDAYNEQLSVYPDTPTTIKVKSDYFPGSRPEAGEFKGSAVMIVDMM